MQQDTTNTLTPDVARLLGFVDQFNQIARDAFADGDKLLGARAITISAQYLQAAEAMQRMHDAFAALQGGGKSK